MASTTPRGIQEIQWNRKDGSVGTAFRVRITRRIQTRSATPVDSVNEGGVLRAVDQQFSVHSQR